MAVDQYVRDVIGSTRALSTPFIEKPSEINASPIYASAFHPSLLPARGDESYQAKLIQEELIAKGGIGDDEIDKNTIMFYQSYYGLRANSLSKFAPPRHSETYQRNGGEYFNAYSELVSGFIQTAESHRKFLLTLTDAGIWRLKCQILMKETRSSKNMASVQLSSGPLSLTI